MTRAAGWYEREIANGPAPRVQRVALLPRRTASQVLKIE
jgi:hypothetical protein